MFMVQVQVLFRFYLADGWPVFRWRPDGSIPAILLYVTAIFQHFSRNFFDVSRRTAEVESTVIFISSRHFSFLDEKATSGKLLSFISLKVTRTPTYLSLLLILSPQANFSQSYF